MRLFHCKRYHHKHTFIAIYLGDFKRYYGKYSMATCHSLFTIILCIFWAFQKPTCHKMKIFWSTIFSCKTINIFLFLNFSCLWWFSVVCLNKSFIFTPIPSCSYLDVMRYDTKTFFSGGPKILLSLVRVFWESFDAYVWQILIIRALKLFSDVKIHI